jgi:hypothetical protein
VRDLDPLIILSPSTRMGTTLVQRLLCSANDCLIYGDTVGNETAFLASWLSSRQFSLESQAGRSDPMLQAVLAGDTSNFIAELTPKSDGYLQCLTSFAAAPQAHCKAEAASHGRPVWGWKLAGAQAWFVHLLPSVLPKARVIIMDRNLEDTARSAKASQHFGPGADFQRHITDAVASRAALATLSTRLPVFKLSLEDLLDDPARKIAGLEDFAGCASIDRGVLSVKVNYPHSPLRPPADLTAEEVTFIRQFEPAREHAHLA